MPRSTHTYVTLPISRAAFDEIREKLAAVDYHHAFEYVRKSENEVCLIDMHGLALVREDREGIDF